MINNDSPNGAKYPLFSIIVPVYNTANYLPRFLKSVSDQEQNLFELILIDDGSTDGSSDICDAYVLEHNNSLCVHKVNAGVSSARNQGLDIAQGLYVWFCDSDDCLVPNALQTLSELIKPNYPKLINVPVEKINSELCVTGYIPAALPSVTADMGPIQCNDYLYPFSHVVLRNVIKDERFDTGLALQEDRDFFYRICWLAAGDTASIEVPLYRYLVTRQDSATNRVSAAMLIDSANVQYRILSEEKRRGHLMPALRLFSISCLRSLSRLYRMGASDAEVLEIVQLLLLAKGDTAELGLCLRALYWAAIKMPTLFCLISKVYGLVRRS